MFSEEKYDRISTDCVTLCLVLFVVEAIPTCDVSALIRFGRWYAQFILWRIWLGIMQIIISCSQNIFSWAFGIVPLSSSRLGRLSERVICLFTIRRTVVKRAWLSYNPRSIPNPNWVFRFMLLGCHGFVGSSIGLIILYKSAIIRCVVCYRDTLDYLAHFVQFCIQ